MLQNSNEQPCLIIFNFIKLKQTSSRNYQIWCYKTQTKQQQILINNLYFETQTYQQPSLMVFYASKLKETSNKFIWQTWYFKNQTNQQPILTMFKVSKLKQSKVSVRCPSRPVSTCISVWKIHWKSTFQKLVQEVLGTLRQKGIMAFTFIDIQGSFDSARFDVIRLSTRDKGVDAATVIFIRSMLNSWIITDTLKKDLVAIKAAKVCKQGF